MAQDSCARTPLWSESHSSVYDLSEEQAQACLERSLSRARIGHGPVTNCTFAISTNIDAITFSFSELAHGPWPAGAICELHPPGNLRAGMRMPAPGLVPTARMGLD